MTGSRLIPRNGNARAATVRNALEMELDAESLGDVVQELQLHISLQKKTPGTIARGQFVSVLIHEARCPS